MTTKQQGHPAMHPAERREGFLRSKEAPILITIFTSEINYPTMKFAALSLASVLATASAFGVTVS